MAKGNECLEVISRVFEGDKFIELEVINDDDGIPCLGIVEGERKPDNLSYLHHIAISEKAFSQLIAEYMLFLGNKAENER